MSQDSDRVEIDLALLPLSEHARNLHRDGYHRDAVRHEAQRLLNRLRVLADLPDLDGQALVEHALADQSPVLALNARATQLERDQHAGLRYIMLGVTRGVRNIVTHDIEHDVSPRDSAIWLGLIGWLHERLDEVQSLEPHEDD